ncbi:conserved exported protein of unknown function [Modestobacter italicus]|uniref:Secreted protein n=1 Tax=Modestobacter italicus (strain DSM 44449 / CECT 9708 / BC 501) TaxID=2732864 RepID=I4EYU8_MODI5|nr:hypothetical protein [Modestobacter marinus]CCH88561.1 conserved exported protein of unknown function [Modestobacter marinus]
MTLALAAALLCVCASGAVAAAHPVSCQLYDAHGVCVVEAGSDGLGARPTTQPVSEDPNSGGESTAEPTCTVTPLGTVIPCQSDDGWWLQSMQCYAQQEAQPPKDALVWNGHTDGAIYVCTYYTGGRSFPGTSGFSFWSATPPAGLAAVDPAVLAEQALRTLTIPTPTTGRYPAGTLQDGQPFTVVNAYTWFWSDAAAFHTLSVRADAGGVWAQVTVTPTSLSFTPGDGAGAVSCAGPGAVWQPADGVWSPSPAGCDYRYPHSSIHQPDREVTATYGIQWSVAWTSSTGASGTLPQLTTTSNATFAVAEAQAVVTR